LGQLMGAKGCKLPRQLAHEKSYMIISGNGEYYTSLCFWVARFPFE